MSSVEAIGPGLRVLLIEGDPACSTVLCKTDGFMADAGISFERVFTLHSALERLGRGGLQVVLLDLDLPDCQGTETFTRLKAADPFVALIVLSDQADDSVAAGILQDGAQDYLVKGEITGLMLRRAIRYATERKRAEIALEREREFSRIMEDSIPDRIYFKDAQSRFLRINRAMADLFHLKECEEAIGKSDFDMFLSEHAQQAFEDEARIMETGTPLVGLVEKETFPDGSIGWATTTKLPFYDRHRKLLGTFGISRDITAAKEAEEKLRQANAELALSQQLLMETLADLRRSHEELKTAQLHLIQAEKMQSLGRLSAGIAHEVKNPLAVIRMGADYLNHVLDPGNIEAKATIQEMIAAVQRADRIVRGLLDFSTPHELALQQADVHSVINQALDMVKHELTQAIQVVKNFDEAMPPLSIDYQKVEQVLVNLLTNAVHAMEQGGTLTIRSHVRRLQTSEVIQDAGSRRNDRLRQGQSVAVIEVMDTGHGLTMEQLSHVFDPFFTTKATGKGTGLGMTVAKSIVELHGGQITIRNRETRGALVTIVLPLQGLTIPHS